MKVEVIRSGGFAGISLRGTVDTAALPRDVAAKADAALGRLAFGLPPAPPHPDGFQYEITVGEGDSRRSAVLNEAELPAALQPIVQAAARSGSLG